MINKFLKLYDEIVNITSFCYSSISSFLTIYTLNTKEFSYYTPILINISVYYTLFSTPLYLFQFVYNFYKSRIYDKNSDEYKLYNKEKNNSIEFIIHHVVLIFLLFNKPKNKLNLNFYLEFSCMCHLFEISTIILALLHSNILKYILLNNNKKYIEFLKIIFILLFFIVRLGYLLPKIFTILINNNFHDDYLYKYTLYISFVFLSILHFIWTKKMVNIIYNKYIDKKID